MKETQITKTLKEVKSLTEKENHSIGFCRLSSLPKRIRKALNLSHLINGGCVTTAHSSQVNFFESMTDSEFVNYLKLA